MAPGISFVELLAYTEEETRRWKDWFASHPEALDAPCDVAKTGTVRKLLLHIFAAELYFACAVLDLPRPDWENLPSQTVDELFRMSEEGHCKYRDFFARAQPGDWAESKELGFGGLKATKRKMVAQGLIHGVHHRGQLAMTLRQQGFGGLWTHDLILSRAMA